MFCLGQNTRSGAATPPTPPSEDACALLAKLRRAMATLGRPPLDIKRNRQFNVGLTAPEYDLLLSRAARAGMRPVDYARARLFAEWRVTASAAQGAAHLDPLFLHALSRLGNNLNQIARRLNLVAQPAPPSLDPLLQDIRRLLKEGLPRGS